MYRILGIIIIKINQNSKINNPEKSRKVFVIMKIVTSKNILTCEYTLLKKKMTQSCNITLHSIL